mmetsp:Transcript_37283/g.42586  ORF Transcript_37283/g.42586 Transcript_37283/m.42586 type:complete len:331 (+) Transcript_37283:57-1049(+)
MMAENSEINDNNISTETMDKTILLRAAISGGFAGGIAKTIMAPIERIKLLLQLQQSSYSHKKFVHQKSSWQIAIHIYRSQGLLAFWKGNAANLYLQAGTSGLNFVCMDYYKEILQCTSFFQLTGNASTIFKSLVSGGFAGATATTVLYPIQFIRTRLAADVTINNNSTKTLTLLHSTLKTDGITGLYQGYGISVFGVFLYRSLHLGGYDAIKTLYFNDKEIPSSSSSWVHRIIIAQFVSLAAGTLCYPIDSVRRRLMMQVGRSTSTDNSTLRPHRKYKSALHAFRTITCKEGIYGFYLGIGPNLIRSIGNAVLLVAYDAIQETLTIQKQR